LTTILIHSPKNTDITTLPGFPYE